LELFEQSKSVTTGEPEVVVASRNGCDAPNAAAPSRDQYRPFLPDGYPTPRGTVG
jgi:hypothetical protein